MESLTICTALVQIGKVKEKKLWENRRNKKKGD